MSRHKGRWARVTEQGWAYACLMGYRTRFRHRAHKWRQGWVVSWYEVWRPLKHRTRKGK